jgi:hypothetical protein
MGIINQFNELVEAHPFITYHVWWTTVNLSSLPISLLFLVISFAVQWFRLVFGKSKLNKSDRFNRLVVISGCDTGFGRQLAIFLAQHCGYVVLAGCLNEDNVDQLEKEVYNGNLYAHPLDVTSDSSVATYVEKALSLLNSRSLTMYAVVNNAGIGNFGAIDLRKMDKFKLDMEVNRHAGGGGGLNNIIYKNI